MPCDANSSRSAPTKAKRENLIPRRTGIHRQDGVRHGFVYAEHVVSEAHAQTQKETIVGVA
jgi:hypothetical protein